ncbi:glycosyltransferase family 4 protein [Patescibacteria group bacterium]|nr:glycosyltransferase family 4 protein [Patescibacteria group bacterium]
MKKNVLIINSSDEDIYPLFETLRALNDDFLFSGIASYFNANSRSCFVMTGKKYSYFVGWFVFSNLASSIVFLTIYPLYFLVYSLYLMVLTYVRKIDVVVCISLFEKIVFSIPARLLGLRLIWIELPGEDILLEGRIIRSIFKINSKFCHKVLTYSDYSKEKLKIVGVDSGKILRLLPSIDIKEEAHQDNLFNNMAMKERGGSLRRFFTVGVIENLNNDSNIGILFQAVKKCIEVIPNLQVIVIGEGDEKNNLVWMAKTMKLENVIWFVGKQVRLHKWINNFDSYVCVKNFPTLVDLTIALKVMYARVPIIAQRHVGFEEQIVDLKGRLSTLVDIDNIDVVAKKIVEIEQKVVARDKIGQLQREKVLKEFTIDKQIAKLREAFN